MADRITLYRKLDQVFAHCEGREDAAVTPVWVRPVSGKGREVSFLAEKEEFAMLKSLDELDPESRRIAEEELSQSYFMPEIRRIIKTEARFGNRYWEVETDKGPRAFAMKNPYINIKWIGNDEVLIRDVIGNMFHISSYAKLDEASKLEFEKVT
ncbi:MAG: DUF1854 domain-containing protein [Kiritimatiellae bacterium]|nr:DUF1854 domain-containing protein [Kiritimatiellia bacterium]